MSDGKSQLCDRYSFVEPCSELEAAAGASAAAAIVGSMLSGFRTITDRLLPPVRAERGLSDVSADADDEVYRDLVLYGWDPQNVWSARYG